MSLCFRWCGPPAIRSVVLSAGVQTCMCLGAYGNRPPYWFATILSSEKKCNNSQKQCLLFSIMIYKREVNNRISACCCLYFRGNWIGEAPYKTGKPCSACPSSYGGSCNKNQCDSRSTLRKNGFRHF